MNSPGNMAETKGSVIKARGKVTCFKKHPAHFEKQHSSFLLYFVILIKTLEQSSAYKEVGNSTQASSFADLFESQWPI